MYNLIERSQSMQSHEVCIVKIRDCCEIFIRRRILGEKRLTLFRGVGSGEGEYSSETERIVVEKWCYVPELYKVPNVQEESKKWVKNNVSIEIFLCKFKNYLKKFKS